VTREMIAPLTLPRSTPSWKAKSRWFVDCFDVLGDPADELSGDPVVRALWGRTTELIGHHLGLPVYWRYGKAPTGVRLLHGVLNDPRVSFSRLVEVFSERRPEAAAVYGRYLPGVMLGMMLAQFRPDLGEVLLGPDVLRLERLSPRNPIALGPDGEPRGIMSPIVSKTQVDEVLRYKESLAPASRRGRPVGAKGYHLTTKKVLAAYRKLRKPMPKDWRPGLEDLRLELGEMKSGKIKYPSTDTIAAFLSDNNLPWPLG
jgi:hypothetical protein